MRYVKKVVTETTTTILPSEFYDKPGSFNNIIAQLAKGWRILEFRLPQVGENYIPAPFGNSVEKGKFGTLREPRFIVYFGGNDELQKHLSDAWE